MDWSAEDEVQLFFAMEGLRPVGLNRHFHVFCIAERLSKYLNRDVPPDVIWKKLQSMYNLAALDKLEPLPFSVEEEFSLPDADFLVMKKRHEEEKEKRHDSDGSTSSGCPPSIIAVSDSSTKDKSSGTIKSISGQQNKELDKKISCKLSEAPKRAQKRTRGSMSLESSPSTTPPPVQGNKRRRI